MWREGTPYALLMGKWIGVATMENSMEGPQKLKIQLPYDLAILLLGIYPKKTLIWKDICTPMFIAALYILAKTQNLSVHGQMNEWRQCGIYMSVVDYYPAIKKNGILPYVTTQMDLEAILSERS